jgi:hypothetical protein
MLRRVLIPSSPLLAAAVIAKSDEKSADGKTEKSLICKPSQLPIYTSLVDRWSNHHHPLISSLISSVFSEPKLTSGHGHRKPSALAQSIEDGVRVVRVEVQKVGEQYEMQRGKIDRYYVDFLKDTQRKFDRDDVLDFY